MSSKPTHQTYANWGYTTLAVIILIFIITIPALRLITKKSKWIPILVGSFELISITHSILFILCSYDIVNLLWIELSFLTFNVGVAFIIIAIGSMLDLDQTFIQDQSRFAAPICRIPYFRPIFLLVCHYPFFQISLYLTLQVPQHTKHTKNRKNFLQKGNKWCINC